MSGSTAVGAEVTNEQIAESIGGAKAHPEWYWFRHSVGVEGDLPDMPEVAGQKPVYAGPDFLNDPATLGEAERYCRERGWRVRMQYDPAQSGAWAVVWMPAPPGSVTSEVSSRGWGDTTVAAVWEALSRASQPREEG